MKDERKVDKYAVEQAEKEKVQRKREERQHGEEGSNKKTLFDF